MWCYRESVMNAKSKAHVRQKEATETRSFGAKARVLGEGLTSVSLERQRPVNPAPARASHGQTASEQMLTGKFQAYLKTRGETRRGFAKRAGLAPYTLSRLFPKRSNRRREFFSRRTLQAVCRATEGHISWRDLTSLARPYIPTKRHQTNCVAPEDMTPLTRKFEAYLESQKETRAQFAERLGVTSPWLSHVFPINPNATPRRLGIEAALRFCKGTEGHLTLADFHESGLCPAMEEVIQHSGVALGPKSGRGERAQACI
jgi:transcriptional regulator with XRE-family HTH domain